MKEEAMSEHKHDGIRCPRCDHSDRMHRTGVSQRFAGCMERVTRKGAVRLVACPCVLTPAVVRESDPLRESQP